MKQNARNNRYEANSPKSEQSTALSFALRRIVFKSFTKTDISAKQLQSRNNLALTLPKVFTTTLILLTLASPQSLALTNEQSQAKIKGIELYTQHKAISAIEPLQIAAEGGDDEALYYLGEALRKNNRHMTPEAKKAYESSAKKGNIYAMIRLGRIGEDLCTTMKNCPPGEDSASSWVIKAKSLAVERAKQGDSESMYLLYEMTGNDEWLEKSAENGFAFAQFRLATKYQEGNGSFLLPSRRKQAIERWMKASAENGYPLAMMGLAAIMIEKNDLASFRFWNEKAADSSYVEGVFGYASYIGEENSKYGFAFDPIKSFALLSNLLELNGGGNVTRDVNDTLPDIEKNLSKEQLKKAKELAITWKATHPPLSFFPDKLGY
ncbi:tetratricopeptide repeat protein [Pseudomonas siliginis]|uniref:tetratricopeptide repeat protein n=1 Tax=Pseudomonas siliginis TaxID=2842346 RepID=UPI0020939451|nr:sel1 repeat family protein [Pseudomonas siliginis]UST87915.1 sel1 repeat family protein [Pseudomonas siliginis]